MLCYAERETRLGRAGRLENRKRQRERKPGFVLGAQRRMCQLRYVARPVTRRKPHLKPTQGIVTSFEMITVPNKVWAEARLYPPTQNLELIEALMKYHEGIEKDNKATLIFHATSQATLLVFFYTAPVDNPAVFKPYYDIPFLMKLIEPGCRTVYEVMQGIANVLQAETLSCVLTEFEPCCRLSR